MFLSIKSRLKRRVIPPKYAAEGIETKSHLLPTNRVSIYMGEQLEASIKKKKHK
ncbi:hypothetical protein AXF42_Ash021456 [Apostasia shenzhenica]|uniref:Uncharacterized protein n=1 Tax=Apostasia shenzhenica TaxID=1088818 RepID=A0A2H9ZUF3_9ASPA|nr:hypothetical protein AXF42_Ash021456 [Apostasia shenzhenica]